MRRSGASSPATGSRCSSAGCGILTTSPTTSAVRRSRSTATWNGTSTRRGSARTASIHMIPGGDGGYRNGTGKVQDEYFDIASGAAPYASWVAGRRRDLSELRLSIVVLRQPVRSRLVARPSSLHGAHAGGRHVPRARGYRRVRARRADANHGSSKSVPTAISISRRAATPGNGGLYKVSWTGAKPAQPDMTGILAVVRQPQPLSSWGWAAIENIKIAMGATAFG